MSHGAAVGILVSYSTLSHRALVSSQARRLQSMDRVERKHTAEVPWGRYAHRGRT